MIYHNTGFPLSWLKIIPGLFHGAKGIFPGHCHKPAMFKYSNKQQLEGLGPGKRCNLSQWDRGISPGCKNIFGIPAAQKMYLLVTITAIFIYKNMTI